MLHPHRGAQWLQTFAAHGARRVGPDVVVRSRCKHRRKSRCAVAGGHANGGLEPFLKNAYLAPCSANSARFCGCGRTGLSVAADDVSWETLYATSHVLAIDQGTTSTRAILFIPLASVVFQLGLFDTRLALILTYPTFLIPFCTWLLMGYFRTIPFELEECALIDGATRWQILVKIVLPLAVPGLISAGIFAFTLSWNEFIYALTFVSSSEIKTLPVGVVTELVEGDVYHWGSLMAGALFGSLPVAFIYSFFVEYYVSGMTGSVKE